MVYKLRGGKKFILRVGEEVFAMIYSKARYVRKGVFHFLLSKCLPGDGIIIIIIIIITGY